MGLQSLTNDSGSNTAGNIVYNFAPVTGAEYTTPLCTDDAVYRIAANFTDPQQDNAVVLEVFPSGNNTTPAHTVTIFADEPYLYPGAIGRIRILSAGNAPQANYYNDGSVITISKLAKVEPARTGLNNDGFGDVFVHVEAHNDWAQSGAVLSGYGWNDTRRWQGWSYNFDMTGVYRIGRSDTQVSNRFQFKPLNSQTWQNLANYPSDIEFGGSSRLTQAEIYDTQNFTYVIFRCNTTGSAQTVTNTVDNTTVYNGTWNVYLARYNKSSNVWNMLGAYNITTYGDPTFTIGPKKFFIAQDSAGNTYLFPWGTSNERTSNTFFRYNITTGGRSQATDAVNSWVDGAFIGTGLTGSTSGFFASRTTGIGATDASTADYTVYNPLTNTWTIVAAPSRTGEGTTWNRGGSPFRYSSTAVGIIGRRTYQSGQNVAPGNQDRFYSRKLWTYDLVSQTWTDRSADLGLFYPHIMRPSNSVVNDQRTFQGQTSDWNGRFLTVNAGDTWSSRGHNQYVNVLKPRQVQIVGATGRPRGEMSVGSWSVMAFGIHNGYNTSPVTYQNSNSNTGAIGGVTFESPVTGGWEIVYIDGTVKYGPSKFCPQNVIYDPTTHRYYLSGWQNAFSRYVSTTNAVRWEKTSYVVDEKTGEFFENSADFYGNSADRGAIAVYAGGLALTPSAHFIRPYNTNAFLLSNIIGGMATEGTEYQYQGLADYEWNAVVQPTDTTPTVRTLSVPDSTSQSFQIVAWGNGPRNTLGIPEGTLFWNGRTLRQYSLKLGQSPFLQTQNGWRIVYTVPTGNMRQGAAFYGTPKVWRDKNFAICMSSFADSYYVFDLNNLYTRDPRIIGSHVPIDTVNTPLQTVASSQTISDNIGNQYISNKACVAGVEIIYGHLDSDGVRPAWFNDNIYIVKDPTPSGSLSDDRN